MVEQAHVGANDQHRLPAFALALRTVLVKRAGSLPFGRFAYDVPHLFHLGVFIDFVPVHWQIAYDAHLLHQCLRGRGSHFLRGLRMPPHREADLDRCGLVATRLAVGAQDTTVLPRETHKWRRKGSSRDDFNLRPVLVCDDLKGAQPRLYSTLGLIVRADQLVTCTSRLWHS